jgi:hypothetical protein
MATARPSAATKSQRSVAALEVEATDIGLESRGRRDPLGESDRPFAAFVDLGENAPAGLRPELHLQLGSRMITFNIRRGEETSNLEAQNE